MTSYWCIFAEFSVFKRCLAVDLEAQARWGESWAPCKTLGRGIATKHCSGAHLSPSAEHLSLWFDWTSKLVQSNQLMYPYTSPNTVPNPVKAKPYVRCYSFIYRCSPLQLRPSPSPSPTFLHSCQLLLFSIHSLSFQLTCCTIVRWCLLTLLGVNPI